MKQFLGRHPLAAFFVVGIGVTWAVQLTFLLNGLDLTPALLIELATLLSSATILTATISGRAGVRRLYAGLLRWRIGLGRWLLVLLAMPVLTVLVGATTSSMHAPATGWPAEVASYLFLTLVFGALLGNAWEETAWSGFVQARLMDRHGLVTGSLLTSIPFFLIHIPLAFASHGWHGTTWAQASLDWVLLALAAPFLRYLAGTLLVDTGGSVLAVAVLHASFNASGSLSAVGGWQYIPAMIVLALLVAGYRAISGRASRITVAGPALTPPERS